jgi:uncharacterized secreted protein with C-terminal beta-propeller domain
MSRRLLVCATLAATVVVAGCTADTPTPPPPSPSSPRTFDSAALRLVAFDSCERLTKELRAAAMDAVGPWGLGLPVVPAAAAMEGGGRRAAGPAVADAQKSVDPAYSGTNVHEQGVDEPDIVKTDGRRIVTVEQGVLRVVDATARKQVGRLALEAEGGATGLLLAGDRALVLVETGGVYPALTAKPAQPVAPRGPELILVDLSGDAPRVLSRFEGEGELVDARLTGTTARVVLRTAPRIAFPELPYQRDEKDRVQANRKAIDKAPADAWLPGWKITTGTRTETGRVGCGEVQRPPVFSGSSMVTVHTFDLAAAELGAGDPVAVVADGDTVYGTATSLYIASDQRWRLDFWPGRDNRRVRQETQLYRFETPAGAKPVYAAAGSVPGWLINQYALSEWDGHLRVATTDESAGSSAIRVLRQQDGRLTQVGEVDGLGKGERIYSVRFVGPRGYLVTFRQTDPLYSVDLSDPAEPKVTGELKITGFSAHLQPVGEDRLAGIGQEADSRGRVQGTQVSLFDVSDPAAPRRLAQHHVRNGQSEAEYDPHAVLWWPATNLLVVPVTSVASMATSALALRVTDAGLTRIGEVVQPRQAEGYAGTIRRSLVVGDVLWTMSEFGLQASSLSTMEPITFVRNA